MKKKKKKEGEDADDDGEDSDDGQGWASEIRSKKRNTITSRAHRQMFDKFRPRKSAGVFPGSAAWARMTKDAKARARCARKEACQKFDQKHPRTSVVRNKNKTCAQKKKSETTGEEGEDDVREEPEEEDQQEEEPEEEAVQYSKDGKKIEDVN